MAKTCDVCGQPLPEWFQRYSPYRWKFFEKKVCRDCGNAIRDAIRDAMSARRKAVSEARENV